MIHSELASTLVCKLDQDSAVISEKCMVYYMNAVAALVKHSYDGIELVLNQHPEVFVRIFNDYLRFPVKEIQHACCRVICSAAILDPERFDEFFGTGKI